MKKDDEDIVEEETIDSWKEYLEQYQYEDFFDEEDEGREMPVELTEPYFKNDFIFANAICTNCNIETLTLIKQEQNVFMSKCPKCLTTYKTKSNGE